MRLAYLKLCGFRGYRQPLEIQFSQTFTVIDGRNGVGKSSIFDAIEFALLGSITKYGEMSAAGETVENYIWWRGPGSNPSDRFVEVGFEVDGEVLELRRTMLEEPDKESLEKVTSALMSAAHAPASALRQLCTSTIIRDELIAELSLDLKEGERFKRLRDALGAADAEKWIKRASRIHEIAKNRRDLAQQEVNAAISSANTIAAQIEETRRSIPDRAIVDEATRRLREFARTPATSTDADVFRAALANAQSSISSLAAMEDEWPEIVAARAVLAESQADLNRVGSALAEAEGALTDLESKAATGSPSSSIRGLAENYGTMLATGEIVGLQDGHCPLCDAQRTSVEFQEGINKGRDNVAKLDAQAVAQAELEQKLRTAQLRKQELQTELTRVQSLRSASIRRIQEFDQKLLSAGFLGSTALEELRARREAEQLRLQHAQRDFAIVDSLRLSATLDSQLNSSRATDQRKQAAEEKLGIARRAEARAKAIYDTARRTSGEILDKRLELVMPLMSEFYKRLRPHPIWDEIDYKLRGDVQKSLRLQVGEDLNPQFIYSSGQRRATGLAFLLSVNLSLTWNNWKTIMLDDPVQHIDDFRSVHLAEVLSKILATGKQIICATEDEALANLIVRHLSIDQDAAGKRITLGVDSNGALAKTQEYLVTPMPRNVFAIASPGQLVG